LRNAGIEDDRVTMIVDEAQAIDAALKMGRVGDLVLIFADALVRGWKQIVNFNAGENESGVPAPRAARAVPREAVQETAPADDIVPAKTPAAHQPMPITWSSRVDEMVLTRDTRGVIPAREAND
jgi:cyanophycin synthetase